MSQSVHFIISTGISHGKYKMLRSVPSLISEAVIIHTPSGQHKEVYLELRPEATRYESSRRRSLSPIKNATTENDMTKGHHPFSGLSDDLNTKTIYQLNKKKPSEG